MDQEEEKSEVNLHNCLRFQYFKKAMFKGTKWFEILGTIVLHQKWFRGWIPFEVNKEDLKTELDRKYSWCTNSSPCWDIIYVLLNHAGIENIFDLMAS